MPPKKYFAEFFFANWTLAIMVIKDANYYTAQHDLKAITLVDQDYSSRQESRSWSWCVESSRERVEKVFRSLFQQSKMKTQLKDWIDDPTSFWAHNREKFPLLSHVWRRVGTIKGASASAERIFSLAGFLISGWRWNMDAETLNCIVLQHNWLKRNLIWVIDDSWLIVCVFFCECPQYFLLQ